VIATTNLFGDILSDEISGLVGGLGLAPARTSERMGLSSRPCRHGARHRRTRNREPHRCDARLLHAARHIGQHERAGRVRSALERTIRERKVVTRPWAVPPHDEFTNGVIAHL